MLKILDNTLNTYKTAAKKFTNNPTTHPIARAKQQDLTSIKL